MQPFFAHGIVDVDCVHEAAVIPQQQVANSPFVIVLIDRPRDTLVNLIQQRVTFLALQAYDAVSPIRIKIK